jgi:hypothetical protein
MLGIRLEASVDKQAVFNDSGVESLGAHPTCRGHHVLRINGGAKAAGGGFDKIRPCGLSLGE